MSAVSSGGNTVAIGMGGGIAPKPVPALAPLPDTAFGRVCEAFSRSIKYLPGELQGKLGALLEPKTVFTFVALLAGLAAVSLTPLGPLADLVATAYGAFQLGSSFAELLTAVKEASQAQTSEALEIAAQHMARGLNDSVVDTLFTVAGWYGFAKLRSALEPLAARFMPARFVRTTGGRTVEEPGKVKEPGRPQESSGPRETDEVSTVKDKVTGGLEVVGTEHAAPQLGRLVDGAAVAKGAAVAVGVGAGVYLLYRFARKKKPSRSADGF